MSFIPILSSSPPPFNATDSFEDDDDGFGNFANFQDSLKDIKSEVLKKNCLEILDGQETINHLNGDISSEASEVDFPSDKIKQKNINICEDQLNSEDFEQLNDDQCIHNQIPLNICDNSLDYGKQTEQGSDGCIDDDVLQKEKPNNDEEWADFASANEESNISNIPFKSVDSHSIVEKEISELNQESSSNPNEAKEFSCCFETNPCDSSFVKESSLNNDSDSAEDGCVLSKNINCVLNPKDFRDSHVEFLPRVDSWSEGTTEDTANVEISLENGSGEDFGDFQSTDIKVNKGPKEDFSECANEWEEEFTDFKSGTESNWKSEEIKESFKNKLFQPTFEANFDEEFGSFSSFSEKMDFIFDTTEKVENVIDKSFAIEPMETKHSLIESLDSWLQCSYQQNLRNNVWNQLIDIDKTPALHYHWNNSVCNKKLLKALNIDSRNLLFGHNWNSSIPIFASNFNLNPLEPTKAPLKLDDRSDEKKEMSTQETHQEMIPPAQFDWHSSGLVNPLDASNSSSLLDLDFFFTNDGTPTKPVASATWSLENELLGPDADIFLQTTTKPDIKLSPLLEQILSCAKFSSSAGIVSTKQCPADLSTEAQEILDKIPNLNFMRAKVLMFPIRSSSP